jgi:small subunit ribosomal protein S17
MVDKQTKPKHILTGKVISDKMDKTIVVQIERTYTHPRVQKVMRATKKYKVHDEAQSAAIGDVVEIYEGRPMSKTKYMYLARIVRSRSTDNSVNN